MSASTIRNTITESLREQGVSSYSRYAEPVIEALVRYEESVMEALRSYGTSQGLSDSQMDEVFYEAGLLDRPTPEPVNAEGNTAEGLSLEETVATLAQQVRDLANTVNTAISSARNQGVRI